MCARTITAVIICRDPIIGITSCNIDMVNKLRSYIFSSNQIHENMPRIARSNEIDLDLSRSPLLGS